jgi:hypothetical protein
MKPDYPTSMVPPSVAIAIVGWLLIAGIAVFYAWLATDSPVIEQEPRITPVSSPVSHYAIITETLVY